MQPITLLATFVLIFCSGNQLFSQGIHWKPFSPGVWTTEFGDTSKQLAYTDLAAHVPRKDKLDQLPQIELAEVLKSIQFGKTSDGKTYFRIPCLPNENVYGFGLQFDGINKTRKILTLKVDHFSKGGGATHAPVPFFISSRGYGILVNSARFVKFYNMVGNRKDSNDNPPEVDRNPVPGTTQPGPWQAQPRSNSIEAYVHGEGIRLVAFCGDSPMEIVQKYNLFNGGGTLPPIWSLGFWHRVPAKFNAREIEEEIEQFNRYDLALDVVGLEPGWQSKSYPCTFEWQNERFPAPKEFIQGLLKRGIRINLWENPYISKDAKIYDSMYPLSGSHLVWLGIVPDYTLAKARKILIDQHRREHFEIGVSGYKIDEVDGYDNWLWPEHASFPSGTSAETMRQIYGLQLQKMLYQELFLKNNQRTFGLVRASNGCASAYPFAIYSDSYDHQQYVNGISSASLCGTMWCPEIRSASTAQEWINRFHTVCFSPLAMLNAWASGTKPWSFPSKTEAVRNSIQLRQRLIPYLYTAFANYAREGTPPIRALLLETFDDDFCEDTTVYMFGPDILVAPFIGDATKRKIQLPPANWYDFHSGKYVGNDEEIEWENEDLAPLFVRGGSLIPMISGNFRNTNQIRGKDLEIRLYGQPVNKTLKLYEDDGESFDYQSGNFVYREIELKQVDGVWMLRERNQKRSFGLFGDVFLKQMKAQN